MHQDVILLRHPVCVCASVLMTIYFIAVNPIWEVRTATLRILTHLGGGINEGQTKQNSAEQM